MVHPLFLIFMVSREQSKCSSRLFMKISPHNATYVHVSFSNFSQEGEDT
jgi:hypothetical protein